MLNSWGSSSRWYLRSQYPSLVIRGSIPTVNEPLFPEGVFIVRNLYKRKGRILYPMRVWQKKTGGPSSNRIAEAMQTNGIDPRIKQVADSIRSRRRFIPFEPFFVFHCGGRERRHLPCR